MTTKELFSAIGLLDDDLVLAADAPVKPFKKTVWRQILPLAACLCLCVALTRLNWWKVKTETNDSSAAVTADMAAPQEGSAAGAPQQERSADPQAKESAFDSDEPARVDCYPSIINSQSIEGMSDKSACYEAELSLGSEADHTIAAGTLLVLTDADGAAFGSRCTLQIVSDDPIEIGCVPSDDPESPAILQSGSGELSAELPGGNYYFFLANTGDRDVTVTARILVQ